MYVHTFISASKSETDQSDDIFFPSAADNFPLETAVKGRRFVSAEETRAMPTVIKSK